VSEGCPKRMTYGPCGGVSPDGGCELPGLRCTFVDGPLVRWAGPPSGDRPGPPSAGRPGPAEAMAVRQIVVADLPAPALDLDGLRRCAEPLLGRVDAVLLGDHGGARVQFPPSLRAGFVQAEGLSAWVGLNCRDRNRVALEAELAGLAAVGAAAVHCVTGDHTRLGHRPDAQPVFDLDSTRLVALARSAGLLTSVAENPVAPPRQLRAERLAEKVRAGAAVCFVNHTRGPDALAEFATAARAAGADVPLIACVPVVTDLASAAVLRSFTGLELPDGYLDGILDAADPRRAGIAAAVGLAERLLAVPGVRGVNLSGGTAPGREERLAADLAQVAANLVGYPDA